MIAHGDINMMAGCTGCTYADSWGRGCKHSLMLPVVIALSGIKCDKFVRKTSEQIEQQLKDRHNGDKRQSND